MNDRSWRTLGSLAASLAGKISGWVSEVVIKDEIARNLTMMTMGAQGVVCLRCLWLSGATSFGIPAPTQSRAKEWIVAMIERRCDMAFLCCLFHRERWLGSGQSEDRLDSFPRDFSEGLSDVLAWPR